MSPCGRRYVIDIDGLIEDLGDGVGHGVAENKKNTLV